MREIKFRGKRLDNGKWVCGDLWQYQGLTWIVTVINGEAQRFEVDPKTVGQYTGLKDKHGVAIYEGDILRFPPKYKWDEKSFTAYEVFWHGNDCAQRHVGFQMNRTHFQGGLCGTTLKPDFLPMNTAKMKVIGNIYENPELVGDKA